MNQPKIGTDDYIELLIKHLARSKEVFDLAKQYKITPDDFVIDNVFGNNVYRCFVDCILTVGSAPIENVKLLAGYLNEKFKEGELAPDQFDGVAELLNFVYTGNLDEKYFKDTLKDFFKARRVAKITYEHGESPDLLISNLNALAIELSIDDLITKAVDIHPFAKPIFKQKQDLIGTGLYAIDEHIHGLGLSEYAIVIGYSGGGKTVLGTNIVSNNASLGIPAQFISCEEDEVQISQRFYSKFFEIPYTDLHRGLANIQLEEMFKDETLQSKRENLAKNLSLIGLKGLTPVTPNQLYEVIVRKFESSGFIPKVVVLDQLQFVEPAGIRKGMSSWEIEKMAAAELDELSHKPINGQTFALWVLHQAKGKLKKHFSREEIDGFKGIIHKADLVLGIGRDGINASECDIFSLKVRHCADFSTTIGTDFRFMRFQNTQQKQLALEGYTKVDSNPSGPPALPDLPTTPDLPPSPPPGLV